ncbi:MAG TPA: general stress protein CsbD [Verrucomicrobiae bacterium]|nr:general stress protein CsbD [Verrucomicrobiae bacterium]
MKKPRFKPAWTADVKQKLKERYQHLTDADLADMTRPCDRWLERVQQRAGGSLFDLAHLIEEVGWQRDVWTQQPLSGMRVRLRA